LFLLAAPLLGVADSEGEWPSGTPSEVTEIEALSLEGVLPALVSEEPVVWVEGFGWMGVDDLLGRLDVEIDGSGWDASSGSQASLEVLEALSTLQEEREATLQALQRADLSQVEGDVLPLEERPEPPPADTPAQSEEAAGLSEAEAQARFITALEVLFEQGSPWLRVRAQLDGVAQPLEAVEWEGDFPWALNLVEVGAAQRRDERFVTPLHEAAAAGALRSGLLLLDQGADVAALDARRWLPVHYAARHGHAALIALFVAHGSPLDWRGADQRSPLQLAAQYGHEEVIEVLLASASPVDDRLPSQPSALHLAVLGGHTGAVKRLLAAGAEVSAQAGRGVTPLHLAALQADPEILAALLEAGANPETENRDGRTPRDVAARNGHEGVFSTPADLE